MRSFIFVMLLIVMVAIGVLADMASRAMQQPFMLLYCSALLAITALGWIACAIARKLESRAATPSK